MSDYPPPQIGYWYTPYYRDQLRQILSPDELIAVQREIAELAADGIRGRVYATREEAVTDLTAHGL